MQIRVAVPEDALRVAKVHIRTWQIAYRDLLPEAFLDGLNIEERAKRYTFGNLDVHNPQTFLALEGKQVLGFATVGKGRDDDLPGQGELLALYVDPDWWNKGIGLALIETARLRLRLLGYTQAYLWMLKGNERARRFYERDGWQIDGAERANQSFDVSIEERRMVRALESSRYDLP
ncbi:MAG: GNAT family N-acetyltransferase [Acidobacteriota bacterium]|nr:GNAT family N-acetyltransferase [Acidobacteriota bacterium]